MRERKAPRILSALSLVISENMLTMPNSRINSIARDIAFFLIEVYSLKPDTSSIDVGIRHRTATSAPEELQMGEEMESSMYRRPT